MQALIQQRGFTLIEILVVVVIVSVVSVLGLQMLNSNSVERQIQHKYHNFKAAFQHACAMAAFQNSTYGVHLMSQGYGFSRLTDSQWLPRDSEQLPLTQWDDDFEWQLYIDNQIIKLGEEPANAPQLICYPSGEISNFKITMTHPSSESEYVIENDGLWKIQGGWSYDK